MGALRKRVQVALAILFLLALILEGAERAPVAIAQIWRLYWAEEFEEGAGFAFDTTLNSGSGCTSYWRAARGASNVSATMYPGALTLWADNSNTYPWIYTSTSPNLTHVDGTVGYAIPQQGDFAWETALTYTDPPGVAGYGVGFNVFGWLNGNPVVGAAIHGNPNIGITVSWFGGVVYAQPYDHARHVFRGEVRGTIWTLFLDGRQVFQGNTALRPYIFILGDPSTQQWAGNWPRESFEYIRTYWLDSTPPTPTFTPTPTPLPTSTPTPTPTPAVTGFTLYRQYPWLAWYASRVFQPAQVLYGSLQIGGVGVSGQNIRIVITDPAGVAGTHYAFTDGSGNYRLDAAGTGDPDFGSTAIGTWQAQAFYDARGLSTAAVTWQTEWSIVHVTE